jgi:hypothetical protein
MPDPSPTIATSNRGLRDHIAAIAASHLGAIRTMRPRTLPAPAGLNRQLLLELADHLEDLGQRAPSHRFDMWDWGSAYDADGEPIDPDDPDHPSICKTVGCLAGTLVAYKAPDQFRQIAVHHETYKIRQIAAALLGVPLFNDRAETSYNARHWDFTDLLFVPRQPDYAYPDVTRERAVVVLRNLAATGVLDWSSAATPEELAQAKAPEEAR